MDERRLESILRDGPTDEPAYRGDIAARLRDGDHNDATGVVLEFAPTVRRDRRIMLPAAAAVFAVVLVVGLVIATRGDGPAQTYPVVRDPALLVDRWVGAPRGDGTSASFLDFRENGEFVYVPGIANVPVSWGSAWSVDDEGLLTLVLNSEEQRCRIGAVGHYRATGPPAATGLTLSVIDDECALRAADLVGTRTHTACPVGGSDCLGPVDAGVYASVTFDPLGANRYGQLEFTLPSGWAVTADSRAQLSLQPVGDDDRVRVDVWADVAVATPGCDGAPDAAVVGASALADALAAHEGVDASRSETTIDDRDARVMDVAVLDGWSQVCPGEGDEPFVVLLASRSGVPVSWTVGVSADDQVRIMFVDVADGRTAAIVIHWSNEEADSIVESFRISDVAETP